MPHRRDPGHNSTCYRLCALCLGRLVGKQQQLNTEHTKLCTGLSPRMRVRGRHTQASMWRYKGMCPHALFAARVVLQRAPCLARLCTASWIRIATRWTSLCVFCRGETCQRHASTRSLRVCAPGQAKSLRLAIRHYVTANT
jgi:hypothetical protein